MTARLHIHFIQMYAYHHSLPTHTSKYNNDSPSRRRRFYYYYYYTIGQTHWRLSTGLEMKGIERERERDERK